MKRIMIASALIGGMLLGACTMTPADTSAAPMAKMPAAAPMPTMNHYHAMLAASPGVTTSGSGMGMFTYEPATHTLTYEVTYEGLSGPAVAAHIHGPAAVGANGPPVVAFPSAASPIKGTATLTDAQAADLAAGKYYVNVHTAANGGGEIRGQIMGAM